MAFEGIPILLPSGVDASVLEPRSTTACVWMDVCVCVCLLSSLYAAFPLGTFVGARRWGGGVRSTIAESLSAADGSVPVVGERAQRSTGPSLFLCLCLCLCLP